MQITGPPSARDMRRLLFWFGNTFVAGMVLWNFGRGFLGGAAARDWSAGLDLLLGGLGAVLLVHGFGVLRAKRLVEDIPSSKVRSVAMGLAELKGAARAKDPLVSPLTSAACVYYRYTVEELRSRGKRREWVTIDRDESIQPFYLEDETGRLLVDPVGAETILRKDHEETRRDGGLFARKRRYREWRLVPGERIYVLGTVRKTRDVVQERRALLRDRLQALKKDAAALAAFDADRDGQIDAAEWERAVNAEKESLLREAIDAPAGPAQDDLAVGKGAAEAESTFVIADRGERSIARDLAIKAGAALGGSFVLIVYCLVALLSRADVLPRGWRLPWEMLG